MHLYLTVAHEEESDRWLAFLLYEPNRERAKRATRRHCEEEGYRIGRVATHDVNIREDQIVQIDGLIPR